MIAGVGAQPIGDRKFVQGQFVRPIDLVVVGGHFSTFNQTVLNLIAIGIVCVWIVSFRRNQSRIFHDQRLRRTLIVQLEGLGEVVLHRVIAVPSPCLDHLRNDDWLEICRRIQNRHVVSHSADLIHALHLIGHGHLLGQQVKVHISNEFEVIRVPQKADLGKWLTLFRFGRPRIIQPTSVLHISEILGVDVLPVLLIVAVIR